jgi:hypothetical protein
MKTTQKNKRPAGKAPTTESLEERVRRHLNDINSVITEEDIRNVKTVLPETTEAEKSEEPVNKERKRRKSRKQKKENEIDTGEKHVNPWDVLSEGYD